MGIVVLEMRNVRWCLNQETSIGLRGSVDYAATIERCVSLCSYSIGLLPAAS